MVAHTHCRHPHPSPRAQSSKDFIVFTYCSVFLVCHKPPDLSNPSHPEFQSNKSKEMPARTNSLFRHHFSRPLIVQPNSRRKRPGEYHNCNGTRIPRLSPFCKISYCPHLQNASSLRFPPLSKVTNILPSVKSDEYSSSPTAYGVTDRITDCITITEQIEGQ